LHNFIKCSKICSLIEENIGFTSVAKTHGSSNKLLRCFDSVGRRSTSFLNHALNELTCGLVNILNWHELLMEDNVSGNKWGWHSHDIANIFEDTETIWQIFPEESCVRIQLNHFFSSWDLGQILALDRKHWERNSGISKIGIENGLKICWISNLSLIHGANSLSHWNALIQVDGWEFGDNSFFQCLNFIV